MREMIDLDQKTLTIYLRHASELEIAIYEQNLALQAIYEKAQYLGIKVYIQDPGLPYIFKKQFSSVFKKTTPDYWKPLALAVAAGSFLICLGVPSLLHDGSGGMTSYLMIYLLVFLGIIGIMLLVDFIQMIVVDIQQKQADNKCKDEHAKAQKVFIEAKKREVARLLEEDTVLRKLQQAATDIQENINSLQTVSINIITCGWYIRLIGI